MTLSSLAKAFKRIFTFGLRSNCRTARPRATASTSISTWCRF